MMNLIESKMTCFVLFLPFLIGFACSDDDLSKEGDNKVTLLAGSTSKDWRIESFSWDGESGDCYSSSPVIQDDTFTFYVDGVFVFDSGELRSRPEDECEEDDSGSGTWRFNSAQDSIITKLNYGSTSASAVSFFTADSMVLLNSEGSWVAYVPK